MNQVQIKPLLKPAVASLSIPGSKSYTNRSLLIAALTSGKVTIKNPLLSDDTEAMIDCLKTLGFKIISSKNKLVVEGDFSEIKDKTYKLNAKLSGTTIRFILALCTIIPGVKILEGEKGLNKRPIDELVVALKTLGADIKYLEKEGYPPLKISSSKLNHHEVSINGEISSQFISALLMIAPVVGGLTINIVGNLISRPYVDMTIDIMGQFGAKVTNENYNQFIVSAKHRYSKNRYSVEGDFSSAGYFFAIATLTKSTLILKNLNPQSKQADIKFLQILKKMSSKITGGKKQIKIEGRGVKPIKINMEDFPDQVQTLAILAAFANGETIIDGVKSLRIKETERIKALENELSKMGIKTKSTNDRLIIYGGQPKAAVIETYGDHRMAMSFAVAGTKLDGIIIKNPEVVSKTFPEFWEKLKSIGVKLI